MPLKSEIKPNFILRGRVFLTITVLLCLTGLPSNAEEIVSAPQAPPCKSLKPFNDIDELLYQFYINLNSDCLFETPVAELEKVWGIAILSYEKEPRREELLKLRKEPDFAGKPYNSEKDAFFIEVYKWGSAGKKNNSFKIIITEEYYKEHLTLFPEGNLPTLLTMPSISVNFPTHTTYIPRNEPSVPRPKSWREGAYSPDSTYAWSNSDPHSGRVHKIRLGGDDMYNGYGIGQITIK